MLLHTVFPGVTAIDLPQENVWLLHDGPEAVLIDTGLRWDRRKLLMALNSAFPSDFRLLAILQTHAHCDHAGNTAYLARRYGSRIHAHVLETPFLCRRRIYGAGLKRLMFLAGEVALPVRRHTVDCPVQDGDRIPTPIGDLTVIHTPGHTPGHVSFFHEKAGWLFSGDALLNVIPFVRKTALSLPPPIFSMNMLEVRRSVRRIAELAPTALLAGHGRPHTVDTTAAIRAFAAALMD